MTVQASFPAQRCTAWSSRITRNSACPERVRNYYEEASQRENTMAVNNTLSASITAVDIYDALNLHNNEDIYFDTDTHWGAARRVLRV